MISVVKRGIQQLARGASGPARGGPSGATCVQSVHGPYVEAALNGRLFNAKSANAGVAPGTAVGTTAAFSIHNVKGSAVNVAILGVSIGYISGTLGAGVIVACTNRNLTEAVPTGTAIVAQSALCGGGAPQGAVVLETSTLAVAPIAVLSLWDLGAGLATTATKPAGGMFVELGGLIVLPPGGCMSLQGIAAAGTTPLVVFSVSFEEIDIV